MVFTEPCKKYQGYQNRLILIISHHLKKKNKYGNKTYNFITRWSTFCAGVLCVAHFALSTFLNKKY